MSPPKPWEKTTLVQRNAQQSATTGSDGFRDNALGGGGDFGPIGGGAGSNFPPPLPPRPANATTLTSGGYYNNYGTGYGSQSITNPYYYGGASTFPSYGYGYGGYNRLPYGYGGVNENVDFVRLAEEQSRTAFQSVESVVQAFSSVSMMLESTLNAFYSSFRAVLGVADQFSRLKLQMSQILTTFAVVRFIRWLWRRILILLRLRRATGSSEELWRQMMGGDVAPTAAQILTAHGAGKAGSHWPSVIFFTFVIGGPYLIWKLVSKLVANVEDQKRWATGEKSHFVAVALYDFEASSSGELSIRAGQRLRLAPKDMQPSVRGWILGSTDGTAVGLVPANYIKILGKQNVGEASTSNQGAAEKSLPSTSDFSTANLEKLFEESESKSM